MPVIKSAIKRMKQNKVRHDRNRHYSSHMKSMIKLLLEYVKKGDLEKANKIMPKVVSAIDVASKKKLIHKNNASNKKSRIARVMKNTEGKEIKKEVKKETPKKEVAEKKEEKK
ncbi:30S ribosomal protein S20 [Candidatus Peregrinibacteria bacterium]|nr:30S ribosomal protein S20 [Candidatus Peregrinibacteria bacterium]